MNAFNIALLDRLEAFGSIEHRKPAWLVDKPGEDLNPVKTLRMRYDVWRKAQPTSFK